MFMGTLENTIDNYVIGKSNTNAMAYRSFAENFGLFPCELQVFEAIVSRSHKILDLGCGTGRTSFALFEQGYENLQACDISSHMIQIAKQRAEETNCPVPFQLNDARQMSYENDRFDIVFFSYNGVMTIPSFETRLKVFQEIHRVLKPSGKFIFSCYRRDIENEYSQFWTGEEQRWLEGNQNPELHEFGDIIKTTILEKEPVFVHFPNMEELNSYAERAHFSKIEHVNTTPYDSELSSIINTLLYYVVEK